MQRMLARAYSNVKVEAYLSQGQQHTDSQEVLRYECPYVLEAARQKKGDHVMSGHFPGHECEQ